MIYVLLYMQWIRDTNADNAILEACNEWDNFKGKVITFLSTFVVYASVCLMH